MEGPDRRFVISEEDLAEVQAPPPEPPGATVSQWSGELPSVQSVRRPAHQVSSFDTPAVAAAPTAQSTFLRGIRGQGLLAGLAAIALGWLVTEILNVADWTAETEFRIHLNGAAFVAMLGAIFAVVFNGWNEITTRQWDGLADIAKRSAPWGAVVGGVAGFLASLAYVEMFQRVLENMSFEDFESIDTNADLYLVRAFGWAVFGAGVGAATAAVVRSSRKLQNGLLGGAIGGAVGGLFFHWLAWQIEDSTVARLLGLAAIGAGIGLAIAVVETARRQAWLHIVGGGMAGKEFILYEEQSSVGASPKCSVTLIKDPAIQPFHFVISQSGAARVVTAYEGAQVLVNAQPVTQHRLRDGDVIQAGQTSVRYAERAAA
jgi:hypothetical protein